MKFATLIKYTDQGIKNIQDTTKRAADFKAQAEKLGVEITELLWVTGQYDGLMIYNSPDIETATALMLRLSGNGHVTTETLQAFDSSGMEEILKKTNSQ